MSFRRLSNQLSIRSGEESDQFQTMPSDNFTVFRVVTSTDSQNNGRVWVLYGGQRHYLMSFQALDDWGFGPWTIETIPQNELMAFPLSFPINRKVLDESEITSFNDARSLLLQDVLHGSGVEFGAACYPMPVPPGCIVRYADCFSEDEGCNAAMHEEFTQVTYQASLSDMQGIPDESQDFVLSSHVIEHERNPIQAFAAAWKKLRKGGTLFMAVPHMDYTFDHERQLTTVRHLIKDYRHPSRKRDAEHIADVVSHSNPEPVDSSELIKAFLQGYECDVHWHTFTPQNFALLLTWINKHVCKWAEFHVVPKMNFDGAHEFYVFAVK